MFVEVMLLNGELNQMMFLFLHFRCWFFCGGFVFESVIVAGSLEGFFVMWSCLFKDFFVCGEVE